MKASPFSLFVTLGLFIALSLNGFAQAGQYTVQLDSMTAQEAAETKVQQLKAQGLNAYWLKSNVPGQGIRYRVRVGRFASRAAAQNYGAKLKQEGHATDFFAALYEGMSSPQIAAAQPIKKPAPVVPAATLTPQPLKSPASEKTVSEVPAQRQREIKISPSTAVTEKPLGSSPSANPISKPLTNPPNAPANTNPVKSNFPTAPVSAPPAENKSIKPAPSLPSPLSDIKPPRDKRASNAPLPGAVEPGASGNQVSQTPSSAESVSPPLPKASIATNKNSEPTNVRPIKESAVTTPNVMANYIKFEDRSFGYSFEHPNYWNGGNLNPEDLQAQRIDAGAIFRSQEDAAFAHAIWNSLKNANSPAYDNNLIVDLVIKSIGNSAGMQGLTETARRMVEESGQIKTFVDLRTLFRQPRETSPLEFQGKAVIIRANTGILLVVAFYSKESAPTMITAAEKIISSARVP